MAQLFYRYGAMNSGKTVDLLKIAHNYDEQGKTAAIFTSSLDSRSGYGKVKSRMGIWREAVPVAPNTSFLEVNTVKYISKADIILVDEAQFLSKQQVDELAELVDRLDLPVICFGLKTDYKSELFEGSKRLLELADKIEEIKTMCWYCRKKATLTMRVNDGSGEQLQIGGNEDYKPVCRKHYKKLGAEIL